MRGVVGARRDGRRSGRRAARRARGAAVSLVGALTVTLAAGALAAPAGLASPTSSTVTSSTVTSDALRASTLISDGVPAGGDTPVGVGVPPATSASGGAGNHLVALGDSWAAGSAAGLVDPATGACRRSARAYPVRAALTTLPTAWVSRACAGSARTASGGTAAAPVADDAGQFGVLDPHTRVIAVTVGADAVGLGALARACSTSGTPATCDAAGDRTDRAMAALPAALDRALADMHHRAPAAALVITDYPLLADGAHCPKGAADAARAARLDGTVARLNAVLVGRGRTAGARVVEVRNRFHGHGVCAADSWLTPLGESAPTTAAHLVNPASPAAPASHATPVNPAPTDPVLAGAPTTVGQSRGYAALVAPAITAALRPTTPAAPLLTLDPPSDGRSADLAAPLFAG